MYRAGQKSRNHGRISCEAKFTILILIYACVKAKLEIWRWFGKATAVLLPIYPAWYIGVVTDSFFF